VPILNDKIALITGGSSGIGFAVAKRFVEEGAYVFITGRRKAQLEKAVADIGRSVTYVQSDVSKVDEISLIFERVSAQKGRLDILFANAGIAEPTTTELVTQEHFDRTFAINARGVFFTVKECLPLMTDGGSIILNSSVASQKGMPIYATYGATKAALRSYVRTWTAEFASRGIRANIVSPGPVDTPIMESQFGADTDSMMEKFKMMIPMRRLGRTEEIAAAVLFLASDQSSFVTGIDMPVDGGLLAV
jgi:NAD(P)-dependent dehydrogenase (short-subunit alcohol dehydrogenase family)